MGLIIQLLGKPKILDPDGKSQHVRGHQSWALLARILLSERPISRRDLAAELFPDANDPLGSLRWCLAALRKAIGSAEALTGDPIVKNLPEHSEIDVKKLKAGTLSVEEALDLLDGIEPRCSSEFSTWLLVERERLATLIDAHIRQEILRYISVSNFDDAIRIAELGVRRCPLDEGAHILLVKSLALSGKQAVAIEQVNAVEELFLRELDEKPSPALRAAAYQSRHTSRREISNEATINSLIEAGLGALSGGAADVGIERLRSASEEARLSQNAYLQAKAQLELGTALVHAVRGYDDEGVILLHQSVEFARRCNAPNLIVGGLREIGYVEAFAGHRPEAMKVLQAALDLTEDPSELSGIHGVMGFNLVDWGKTSEGLDHFQRSIDFADQSNNQRRKIWALGIGALGQLSIGNYEQAETWLTDSINLINELHWVSFKPWSVALLAETRLKAGCEPTSLIQEVENAFAMACELDDPCWESNAARTLANIHAARKDYAHAFRWFEEARHRCLRETDVYAALYVRVLSDQAMTLVDYGKKTEAKAVARELLSASARSHMDDYLAQALVLMEN